MDKYGIFFSIIDKIQQEREVLRKAGKIGKSEESLSIVEYFGGVHALPFDVFAMLMDEQEMSLWARGPVWTNIFLPACDDKKPLGYSVYVGSIRDDPEFSFCPRCWKAHEAVGNHDDLCTRCLNVLSEAYPDYLRGNPLP